MDKRLQSISTKSFDYKFPLIRHTNEFSYSRLTPLKKKSIYDHLHRGRAGFNFCSSSLSITGLADVVKDHHQRRQKKSLNSIQNFFKSRHQVKRLPQVLTEFSTNFEEGLRGWEVS